MSIDVQINDFNMDQFDQLTALFGSYFQPDNKLLTASYIDWLYAKNPYGLARIVTAVEENRWVGFMALIPVNLVRRDSRKVAYYVVNVLVHPDYQGKHIFSRMINAAKKYVTSEDSVLMGHPNKLALVMWQRARMHFHEPLRPYLVIPRVRARNVHVHDISDLSQLQSVLQTLNTQALQAESWNLAVTEEYLQWRYRDHPANNYRIQQIEADNAIVGIQISRKVRLGISLLLDQFILDRYAADGLACLPWLTVSFRPELLMHESSASFWSLPVKKQIPFFFTHFQQPCAAPEVMKLGLSASDF
jgi:GNAT superfamily N-acetyltransferase